MSREKRMERRALLKGAAAGAVATIVLPHVAALSAPAPGGVPGQGEKPPSGCMNSLFFFDDWLLFAREGLDRKQGRPQMVKEIVIDSHPDPDLKSIRGTGIEYDPARGRYFMIVGCRDQADNRFCTRLETDDPGNWPQQRWTPGSGPLWTRTDNAYLDQNGAPLGCFNVFCLKGTPLADKGYVMTLFDYKWKHAKKPGTPSSCVGFSRDGLHWEVEEDNLWLPHHSDTTNPVVYNPWTKKYLIFCRPEQTDRRICVVTTSDFQTFSPATVVLQPDAQDPVCREFYGLGPILHDDMFVGTLSVYDAEPTEKVRYKMRGTNEMQLAYSYNGRNWYRAFRETFIGRTEPGTARGGSVYVGPVPTPDDRLLFSGIGTWTEHGMDIEHCPEKWKNKLYRTYLYELRRDGFAYLRTRARRGRIRTKAVVPQGGELTINARTTPSGHVKVAVLDTSFKPLPNYTLEDAVPLAGDEPSGKIRWRNRENLDELKGKSVIIEVRVREGELYSLRFPYRIHLGQFPRDRA